MEKIVHFFSRQKLFVNLMVFLILLAGSMILLNMNREAFPNVNFDMVSIRTVYPGASPDEIENLITIPIEKKLREVSGIDKVRSYNIENISVVVVFIDPDASNKRKIVEDTKDAVESVKDLPENSQKPIVEEIVLEKTPVIDLALVCKTDPCNLREEAKLIEDQLYELSGVAQVERFGYLDREYLVDVDPEKMARYRVGLNTLIHKLKSRNFDLPGGVLRIGTKEYLLRTKGQFQNAKEVGETVILANVEGYITKLKQVAKITDTFAEIKEYERFGGREAIILKVWKKPEADTIKVSDSVLSFIKQYKSINKIEIVTFNDFSRFVRSRLSSLIVNASIGFVLLIIVLVLLLGLRMSLIVSVSIPVSFMIAFMGMGLSGITLNIISMFAMVMVLGMIVDFSIVVSENSYRYMENGMNRQSAIDKGAGEVIWPLTTTLLCITAAFAPLLFMTGIIGKFVWGIPMVIIISLSASWFSSMFVLPTHLNIFARVAPVVIYGSETKEQKENQKNGKNEEKKPKRDMFLNIQDAYRRFLSWNIRHRYLSFLNIIIMFFASVALAGFFLGFILFPGGGGERISIGVKMPMGTTLETTLKNVALLEKMAMRLPKDVRESVQSRVGLGKSDFIDPMPSNGTHRAVLIINLTPVGERKITDEKILRQLRAEVSAAQKDEKFDKGIQLEFNLEKGGPPVGMPINIEIRGRDINVLRKMADEYMGYLKNMDGVFDVHTDLEPGKDEFQFKVLDAVAAQVGVSVLDVASAIRTAFDGAVATTVRLGDDEIDVRVRFPEKYRRSVRSLDKVFVANQSGGLIPLSRVAKYEKVPGYSIINRLNYRRVVQVKANVDTAKITSIDANRKIAQAFTKINERYPNYDVNYGGEQEDTNKSLANLGILFIFALLLIYIILATFFQSLILPGVVMSAIPFGLVGVVLALITHGKPLSFMSLLGVVSLAGVIVSNTLVLVQFINNLRREGYSLMDALVEGGAIRLRPVILTSATTVLGLLPTVYGIGGEDAFVAPLALAFGYGLIFATFITLVLIPVFYHIAEDYKGLSSKILGKLGIESRKELIEIDNK